MRERRHTLRLGILASHPIQYFVPVYRALACSPGIDLSVIYRTRAGLSAYHDPGFGRTVQWDIPLLVGYKCFFLSDKTTLAGFEPVIIREIIRGRFDVLIVQGYNNATYVIAMATAKLVGTRVVVRGDTRLEKRHRSASLLIRTLKHLFFRWVDGFLAIGSLNREYYLSFGVRARNIYFSPYCVDNAVFSFSADDRLTRRKQIRGDAGLPEDCIVVLHVSKLIGQKRPGDVIDAFTAIADRFPNAWLVIAGSGELEESLKIKVNELGVERVLFIGFQNQSVMPFIYVASDIFVLPSDSESWGLVVNEAMAAGLPVIVSDEVGAGSDLVREQGTGIVYPCGDVGALAVAMQSMIESETLRLEMGKKALDLIGKWDVNECVSGIVAAVRDIAGITLKYDQSPY